ncbi:MAG: hypothetical protein ABSF53_08600 [Terracidiphilus sp.]
MRFTIERLRTLVLAAGILLVGSLAVFLARGRLKNPLNLKELPQKLGVDIQSDATTFTIDHALGGHSRYRIHASKAVQYKDNHAILKDVQIELYGADGSRVDRIQGAEFDYDRKNGKATASGPVEITLMRPAMAPATSPSEPADKAKAEKAKPTPIASAKENAERGDIHVRTSGLTFDTQSGVAMTAEHVDFSTMQGSGSSMGASYDSKGFLVLDKAVELNTKRGAETVTIHAQHAEFERATLLCRMHAATADYRGGEATAGDAKVLFRNDGSAVRLDAMNGFNLTTETGGHVIAPVGAMDFDEHNQPRHGRLEGGVKMDSTHAADDGAGQRRMRATAATVDLEFSPQGELRHAHLQGDKARGVEMHSDQVSEASKGTMHVSRTWQSPLADVEFRDNGHRQAEPATIHGVQGVVVTGESQRGSALPEPSRLAADDVTGVFGANSALTAMTGSGHASVEETNAAGTRQTSTGDRLEAHFATVGQAGGKSGVAGGAGPNGTGQIQSATIDGHVVLTQMPAAKPATQSNGGPPAPLMAWAGRAVYDGTGEWLHLTVSPRVEDGGLQLTAEKIDVSHESGDAFAHGNVKATWLGSNSDKGGPSGKSGQQGNASGQAGGQGTVALGGQGPAHVVSAEAELSHAAGGSSGEATFKGHARLWQQSNSVQAPVIVLDRQRQTLVAHSTDAAEPVKVVLLSSGGLERSSAPRSANGKQSSNLPPVGDSKPSNNPSVIRAHGGDLKYSDAERRAILRGGELGTAVAETPTATSTSNEIELLLLPAGNHAGKDGGQAQVDRMIARGHVVVTSDVRHGTGEQLLYTGETGEYVLTGTAAAPPVMTDPARGTVTGAALIFNSRDDRVTVDGGGGKTSTATTAPK